MLWGSETSQRVPVRQSLGFGHPQAVHCEMHCIWLCSLGMAQLVTRVEDDLAAAVDELVEAGVVASRSEAVRVGLEQLVDRCRREEIGARIVRGYRQRPQEEAEVAWADESSVRMIAEEPW